MSYSLSFLPEVEEDAIDAYLWYEGKAKGLGEEFLRIFYTSACEMCRSPMLYRTTYKDFRRLLLRRFPYALYFALKGHEITVYGLFHCARDPEFLRSELNQRNTNIP